MIRNYLLTALRNIARHKLYAVINIGGLAVGLACVIFVLLFIRDELSYDKWIPGTENLYRVEKIYHGPGRDPLKLAVVPFPMTAAMQNEIPQVTAMTRINYTMMTLVAGGRQFHERVVAVDPNFFRVIRLPLARGGPSDVFKDPESLVLSQSAARKYFGTADPIGKTVATTANCEAADTQCLNRLVSLKVTGIVRDIPHNSHLDGEVFLPNSSIAARIDRRVKQDWFTSSGYGYVALAAGASPQSVVSQMAHILDRDVTGMLHASGIQRSGSQVYTVHLTPFADVHLTSREWQSNEKPGGSRVTLYGVALVGILILSMAGFNFTNLATAMASQRAREIALRKTLGAGRGQLVIQFLGEAVVTALLSLVAAMALVEIMHMAFENLLQRAIAIPYLSVWPLLFVGIAVATGLAGGAYPALVLSGFRPVAILRAGDAGHAGSGRLRAALVVLQFAISIGLGIALIVIFSQIKFARGIDLGFRKDNVLVISGNGLLTLGGRESFVQALRANSGILDLATSNAVPFDPSMTLDAAQLPGHPERLSLYRRVIGANAIPLLGMKLKAGRFLSDARSQDAFDAASRANADNDGRNVLIDEAAAGVLGFAPRQAVGKTIIFARSHVHIVGVLADVKFDGAREPLKPSVYVYDPHYPAALLARLRPVSMPQTLAFIDRAWHDFAPTKAVQHAFLEDAFGKLYMADDRQGDLFGIFVAVAIFISCLGLFGLAALTARRRTREIGIRKAFGARTRDVVLLLLWQFSVPVLLANLIAWPIAWYYLHGWLQGFADRIALSPFYFLAAGLAALVIAWATIFAHALRVARANPVHALRTE